LLIVYPIKKKRKEKHPKKNEDLRGVEVGKGIPPKRIFSTCVVRLRALFIYFQMRSSGGLLRRRQLTMEGAIKPIIS
jgi:hypothetical protein